MRRRRRTCFCCSASNAEACRCRCCSWASCNGFTAPPCWPLHREEPDRQQAAVACRGRRHLGSGAAAGAETLNTGRTISTWRLRLARGTVPCRRSEGAHSNGVVDVARTLLRHSADGHWPRRAGRSARGRVAERGPCRSEGEQHDE